MDAASTAIVVVNDGANYVKATGDGTQYNLEVKFAFGVTVTQVD